MTPRERILAALEHREPDRLAIDFAGTDCSSAHVAAYHRLRERLGLHPRPIRLACLSQMVVEADSEVQDVFGADARGLFFHPRSWRLWPSVWGMDLECPARWNPETLEDGATIVRDPQGRVRSSCPPGGFYFDPVCFPLAGLSSAAELDAHDELFERWDWPAVCDESVEEYAARARDLYAATDRAVVASWRMHYVQAGQLLRGYEQFMIDLLADEPLARALLDRLHETYLKRARAFLETMSSCVDVIFFTDDLGTQSAPMIGPELYRRLVKPYWTELIALVKRYGKKVLMHSCGAIADFIPDLIEMGVDAVNPVQVTAAGMDPARLKKDFGRAIAFWGGGVSTQGMLDKGTPGQVADEVKRHLDLFAPGGGYVFTQVHNIQFNVPAENIVAAYEAALG